MSQQAASLKQERAGLYGVPDERSTSYRRLHNLLLKGVWVSISFGPLSFSRSGSFQFNKP